MLHVKVWGILREMIVIEKVQHLSETWCFLEEIWYVGCNPIFSSSNKVLLHTSLSEEEEKLLVVVVLKDLQTLILFETWTDQLFS